MRNLSKEIYIKRNISNILAEKYTNKEINRQRSMSIENISTENYINGKIYQQKNIVKIKQS